MRKHRLITGYLACAVFVIQITGLHLHVHDHTAQHQASEPQTIHLAVASDHGGDSGIAHDQDEDTIVSGPGIIKKAGTDKHLLGALPCSSAPPVLLAQAGQPTAVTGASFALQTRPHARPLLRAPPTHHSV